MEPEVVAFLKRVALSIFLSFFWLALNVTIGIRFQLAFINKTYTWGNIVFYIWLVISFVAMLFYFVHLWRKTEKW